MKNKVVFSLLFLTLSLNSIHCKAETPDTLPSSIGVWNVIEHGFPHVLKPSSDPEQKIHHTRAEEVIHDTEEMLASLKKNRWNIKLTKEEKELLAKIVFLEAGNQGLAGQEYIVTVIFNRMTDGDFPSTVYEVLSQEDPTQFVTWSFRNKAAPTEETYKAIENVLSGDASSYITNSYFKYFSRGKGSKHAVKIGDHWFW